MIKLSDTEQSTEQTEPSSQAEPLSLKDQFDAFTQEKIQLWSQIKGKEGYEQTDQWKEIQRLDVKLLELRAQIERGQ